MFKKNVKKDESGAISDEKIVGQFKGIIEVESQQDHDTYIREKQTLLVDLEQTIKNIHRKMKNEEFEFSWADLWWEEAR